MTAQALVVKKAQADVIILYSIAKADAMMIKSLNKVGVDVPLICAWSASSPELWQFTGALAEGTFVMQTYSFLNPKLDALGQTVAKDFMNKYGLKDISDMVTPAFTTHAYDGMTLLAAAIAKSQLSYDKASLDEDRRKLRAALESGLGPVKGLIKTYDPAFTKDNHDSMLAEDYIMTVWTKGKLIPYTGKSTRATKH
ncbi:hypothetical protein C2W62_35985 [Candidatus Entotheonella serta]|nr:hypothetical protein C2W62_35985 [Candidatus Entotheonella serta]